MLQFLTWQEFLLAALILSLIWYAIVLLILYSGRSTVVVEEYWLKKPEPIQHYWDKNQEFEELPVDEDLLGKSKQPEGVSNVSMGSFGFVQSGNEKEEKLGLVPDVIEELKRIFNILAKEDGNKGDFFSLLQLVKVKYPKIGSSPWGNDLNKYIQEHAPFLLTKDELENLWD